MWLAYFGGGKRRCKLRLDIRKLTYQPWGCWGCLGYGRGCLCSASFRHLVVVRGKARLPLGNGHGLHGKTWWPWLRRPSYGVTDAVELTAFSTFSRLFPAWARRVAASQIANQIAAFIHARLAFDATDL